MCIGAASICHNSAGFVGVYMQYANSYTAEFVSGQYEFVSVLLVCWCARAVCEVSYCWFVLGQYEFVSVLLFCRCVCTVCEVPASAALEEGPVPLTKEGVPFTTSTQ